jgi:hypothetical protein
LLNRQLLKSLVKRDRREIEAYRFYIIARKHFSRRSGVFSINEFLDVLQVEGYSRTLHHGPGNNRMRYAARLRNIFNSSMLFEQRRDGRYRARSMRRHFGYSTMFPCPPEALKTKRAFTDFCTCVLISSNGMKSREITAEQTGFTVSRIDYAIKRGQAAGYLEKQNNIIIAQSSDDKQALQRQRGRLLAVHGIATPPLFRFKNQYHVGIYAANNYRVDVSGEKGNSAHLKYDRRRLSLVSMLTDSVRIFTFGKNYSFDDYLSEYGFRNI